MNSLIVKKAPSGFKQEDLFTWTFLFLFLGFFYFYCTDSSTIFGPDSMKLFMWMCGILAAISHFMPKKKAEESLKDEKDPKNLYLINNRLRESLMTAIKLDE